MTPTEIDEQLIQLTTDPASKVTCEELPDGSWDFTMDAKAKSDTERKITLILHAYCTGKILPHDTSRTK